MRQKFITKLLLCMQSVLFRKNGRLLCIKIFYSVFFSYEYSVSIQDKDDFETVTSAIAPEINQISCMVEHVKRTNITVNSTYDGAVLRCITDDGVNKLFSDNTTLNVTGS